MRRMASMRACESIEMRTIAFFPLEESERSDAPGVPTPKARL